MAKSQAKAYFIEALEQKILSIENLLYVSDYASQEFGGTIRIGLSDGKVLNPNKLHAQKVYLTDVLNFVSKTKQELVDRQQIFVTFKVLSSTLNHYGIKDKDKMAIIFEVIEKNLEVMSKADIFVLNSSTVFDFKWKHLTLKKFYDYTQNKNLERLTFPSLFSKQDKQTEEELAEFRETESEYVKRISLCEEQLEVIKNYYFGVDKMHPSDVLRVCKALSLLGVDEQMCNYIESSLMNKINKENEKKKEKARQIAINEASAQKAKQEKPKLTMEDYYQIINSYYDFKNQTPYEYMYPDDLQEFAFALKKVGYNTNDILTLIRDIEFKNNQFEYCSISKDDEDENDQLGIHPIVKYARFYNKIEFYKERYGLEKHAEALKSYFQETFICSQEDYNFWVENLGTVLNDTIEALPKNHEYELQLISRK